MAADFRLKVNGQAAQGWTNIEAYRLTLIADKSIDRRLIQDHLKQYKAQQRLMLFKIIAGILDIPLGELTKRDQVYQLTKAKQRATLFQRIAVAMLFLSLATIIGAVVAWSNYQEAMRQRLQAEKNFQTAKEAADGLVFDIARGLREVEGMRLSSVKTVLYKAEKSFSTLLQIDSENLELLKSQAAMLAEFVETYLSAGDTRSAQTTALKGLHVAKKLMELSDGALKSQRIVGLNLLKVGDAFIEIGEFDSGEQAYMQSLTLRKTISHREPKNMLYKRDISVSLNRLGDKEELVGNLDQAIEYFEQALSIRKTIVEKKPLWRRDLIVNYIRVGDIALGLEDLERAEKSFKKAEKIAREEYQKDIDNTKHKRDLAIVMQRLGNVGLHIRNYQLAKSSLKESRSIFYDLSTRDPGNYEWKRDIAVSDLKLGHTELLGNNTKAALKKYHLAAEMMYLLTKHDQNNIFWQLDLVEILMYWAKNIEGEEQQQKAKKALSILLLLRDTKKTGPEHDQWISVLRPLTK